MNTPFFSIITPSFHAGPRLRKTMESILSQTFSDYEVIVKDAGSEDGSIEALPRDGRIRLIQEKDRGIYDGMNQAIAVAKGEYLYFLNCGDTLHAPDVLEKTAEDIRKAEEQEDTSVGTQTETSGRGTQHTCPERRRAERSGGRIFYGDVLEEKTGQRAAAKPEMTHFAMYRNLPCHQACFYSRDLFETRAFDLHYRVRADYEHFLWCVICRGAKTVAMNRIIADYEGGGFSETKENRELSAREHREIAERYFTKKEVRLFRAAMILSLQPVREKLASSPHTAACYDWVKDRIYHKK